MAVDLVTMDTFIKTSCLSEFHFYRNTRILNGNLLEPNFGWAILKNQQLFLHHLTFSPHQKCAWSYLVWEKKIKCEECQQRYFTDYHVIFKLCKRKVKYAHFRSKSEEKIIVTFILFLYKVYFIKNSIYWKYFYWFKI